MRKQPNKLSGKGRTVTKDSHKVSLNKPTSEIDLPDETNDIENQKEDKITITKLNKLATK